MWRFSYTFITKYLQYKCYYYWYTIIVKEREDYERDSTTVLYILRRN
jgi:hypothetical protein